MIFPLQDSDTHSVSMNARGRSGKLCSASVQSQELHLSWSPCSCEIAPHCETSGCKGEWVWINSFQMAPGMFGGLWVSPVSGRSPSLEILRSGQDTILSNVLCRACWSREVGVENLQWSFQPYPLCETSAWLSHLGESWGEKKASRGILGGLSLPLSEPLW